MRAGICVNRCSSVALFFLLRKPNRIGLFCDSLFDPKIAPLELAAFLSLKRACAFCNKIRVDHAAEFQCMLQARDALFDLLTAPREFASFAELLERSPIDRH